MSTLGGISAYNGLARLRIYAPPSGSAAAWGKEGYGALAESSSLFGASATQTPGPVAGISGAREIAAGNDTAYALMSSGQVRSWGSNGSALGNGGYLDSYRPVTVAGLTNITQIAAGNYDAYALGSDGTLWAWGINLMGELGIGNESKMYSPVQVPLSHPIVSVAAGVQNAYALTTDGHVLAWGEGDFGELGRGSRAGSTTPVLVSGLSNVVAVTTGQYTAYALTKSGDVYEWGAAREYLQEHDYLLPHKLSGAPAISRIFTGGEGGYALDSTGHAYVLSTATHRFVRAATAYDHAKQIAVGRGEGTLILHRNGTVSAVGNGLLAGTPNQAAPVIHAVVGLTGVRSIAAGTDNGYALFG